VELKAVDSMGGREEAQVINYWKATGLERALLINFGTGSLQHERVVLTRTKSA
jgi:GxxExxY protein